jgi:hypothetical protein
MPSEWQIVQHNVAKDISEQLAEGLKQQGRAKSAAASTEPLSTAAACTAAAAGLEAAQQAPLQPLDMVLQYLEGRDFAKLVQPLLEWQRQWLRLQGRLAYVMDDYERDFRTRLRRKRRVRDSLEWQERRQEKAQGSASSKQQQLLERKLLRDGDSSSSSSSDDGISSEDEMSGRSKGSAAAAAKAKGSSKGAELADNKDPELSCPVCKAEEAGQPSIQLMEAHSSSSNSSSGSTGSQAAAGLYGSLPVSWSDPFMMRRLLWDLLGKLKPTAQAWFREHFNMCPHRLDIVAWHAVMLSLARHIWAPPGDWGAEHEAQMWLLLPSRIRDAWYREGSPHEAARAAARKHYAWALNTAFESQPGNSQAAAVLSLHSLLALDPHGARVQPRPELLFYTPAGFHAAVCKTLMQALQVPAVQGPAPSAAATAAAAAASDAGAESDSGQEVGSEGAEKPFSQMLDSGFPSPHYLQAWSDVLFPAWYMWWHIGLLAYHQQQQLSQSCMQQQRQTKQQQDTSASLQAQEPQQQGQAAQQHLRGQKNATGSAARTVTNSSNCSGSSGSASGRTGSSSSGSCSSANRAGGAGEDSSSSSGSGSVTQPVSLQDLYDDPNAR